MSQIIITFAAAKLLLFFEYAKFSTKNYQNN